MKTILKVLSSAFLFLQLTACIEVHDKDKSDSNNAPTADTSPVSADNSPKPINPPAPVAKVEAAAVKNDFLIDQEMHLYKGRILNLYQMEELQFHKEVFDWSPAEYTLVYDKITFTNKGVLYIHGSTLNLKVVELESSHGQIATFPAGQQAADNKVGQNGGVLQLEIGKATGQLTIYLRGEVGGRGLPGADVTSNPHGIPYCQDVNGGDGHQGANGGDSGVLRAQLSQLDLFDFDVQILPSIGGPGGIGGAGWEKFQNGEIHGQKCDVVTGPGGFDFPIPHRGNTGPTGNSGKKIKSIIIRANQKEEING